MSIESMAHVLKNSRAKGTDKLVLLGIANHDGDGGAWPSIATLATYANVEPRGVKKSLRRLEELGELVIHVQAGGNEYTRADRRPNRYEITVIERGVLSVTPSDGVSAEVPTGCPPGSHGVSAEASRGVRTDTLTTPEPSSEPSVEPPRVVGAPTLSNEQWQKLYVRIAATRKNVHSPRAWFKRLPLDAQIDVMRDYLDYEQAQQQPQHTLTDRSQNNLALIAKYEAMEQQGNIKQIGALG